MQETRTLILTILRQQGQATVEDIALAIKAQRGAITTVTIRHHLARLQESGFVKIVKQEARAATRGRPQHVYTLTEQGQAQFPNNYRKLAAGLLQALNQHLPEKTINVILEDVAAELSAQATLPASSMSERLDAVVAHLSGQGYQASWEATRDGYILYTHNCPYRELSHETNQLCYMDMALIAKLLGVVPRLLSRIADEKPMCSYWIPASV